MIDYRLAVRSDLAQIKTLLHEIMRYHGVEPPAETELSNCIATIMDSNHHVFLVAEQDGALVAMCALLFSMSTWAAAPTCEIQDLIVTAAHRGKGIGRGLVDTASSLARARGCTRIFLLAEYWNLEAHAFYRRLGLNEETDLDFERDLRSYLP